jgi:hypothetical protein
LRPGQVRQAVIVDEGDEAQRLKVQLVGLSLNEIRAGVARLRQEPGVQAIEVGKKQRLRERAEFA